MSMREQRLRLDTFTKGKTHKHNVSIKYRSSYLPKTVTPRWLNILIETLETHSAQSIDELRLLVQQKLDLLITFDNNITIDINSERVHSPYLVYNDLVSSSTASEKRALNDYIYDMQKTYKSISTGSNDLRVHDSMSKSEIKDNVKHICNKLIAIKSVTDDNKRIARKLLIS